MCTACRSDTVADSLAADEAAQGQRAYHVRGAVVGLASGDRQRRLVDRHSIVGTGGGELGKRVVAGNTAISAGTESNGVNVIVGAKVLATGGSAAVGKCLSASQITQVHTAEIDGAVVGLAGR